MGSSVAPRSTLTRHRRTLTVSSGLTETVPDRGARAPDKAVPMGAADNVAVHVEWAEAENRHDLSRHSEFLHDDVEVHQLGGELVQGLDAYLTMMEGLYAAMTDFHTIIDDRFATDDRVVCRWRSSGTHASDEQFKVPATGKHIEFPGISLWEFEDGKARRGWTYPDLATIMAQVLSP